MRNAEIRSGLRCPVYQLQGDFSGEGLLQLEKDWIVNVGTFWAIGNEQLGPANLKDKDRLGPVWDEEVVRQFVY